MNDKSERNARAGLLNSVHNVELALARVRDVIDEIDFNDLDGDIGVEATIQTRSLGDAVEQLRAEIFFALFRRKA